MLVTWERNTGKLLVTDIPQENYMQDSDVTVILCGTCYDSEYYRLSMEEIRCHLEAEDYEFFQTCYGIFSIVYQWEGEICFFSDARNLARLYYEIDEEFLFISDRVDTIVTAGKKKYDVDFTAWAEFLSFYYTLGNHTFFKQVKGMYMGERIVVNREVWSLESVFSNNLSAIEENHTLTKEAAVEKAAELLKQSVARIMSAFEDQNKIITLSGGWDSRTLACVAAQIDCKDLYTYSTNLDAGHDREERFAQKVGEYLNIPNQYIALEEGLYEKELERYLADVEFFSSMHIHFWPFYEQIPQEGGIVLDGLAGDLFFRGGQGLPVPKAEPGTDAFYEECFRALKVAKLEKYYATPFADTIQTMAFDSMKEEIKRCKDNLRLFMLSNRLRSLALTAVVAQKKYRMVHPFLDTELVKFSFSLPLTIVLDKEFYPALMAHLDAGVAELPSTNHFKEKATEGQRPIQLLSADVNTLFRKILQRHFEDTYCLYDSWRICRALQQGVELKEMRDVTLLIHYQKWLDCYKEILNRGNIPDTIFSMIIPPPRRCKKEITVLTGESERQKSIREWTEFYQRRRKDTTGSKAGFLCTMDVEAFNMYDPRAGHTAANQNRNLQTLIYGQVNGRNTLEKLVEMREVPFTFFVEVYSKIFQSQEEKEQLLRLCDSKGNEAGLHCHTFSLSKELLNTWGIDYFAPQTPAGFETVIRKGQEWYQKALGHTPLSYRAGDFEVYQNQLSVLAKNGFIADSSLTHQSARNYSGNYMELGNAAQKLEGIWEIPVNTYYDMSKNGSVRMFDLNLTSFAQKTELVVRSLLTGVDTLTMLCHSWSFSNYHIYKPLQKFFHEDFSPNSYDELMYLIEFLQGLDAVRFETCSQAANRLEHNREDGDTCSSKGCLVDVCGTVEERPVYELPPQYGVMRAWNKTGFCQMDKGSVWSSENLPITISWEQNEVQFSLPPQRVPQAKDAAGYKYTAATKVGEYYVAKMFLQIPYYREKFEGRNKIICSIYVNGSRKQYQFITAPCCEDVLYIPFRATSPKTDLEVRLECLETEEPWGWGGSSKVKISHLYIMQEQTDITEYIWKGKLAERFVSLSPNLKVKNEGDGAIKVIYKHKDANKSYFQLFDKGFPLPPTERFESLSRIDEAKWLTFSFRAKTDVEDLRMTVFLMQYQRETSQRIANQSKEICLSSDCRYFTFRVKVHSDATDYKVAFRIESSAKKAKVILDEFQLLRQEKVMI